jgi:polynucleotide 5'-hydroxyl-kinase GRC3/NOL9
VGIQGPAHDRAIVAGRDWPALAAQAAGRTIMLVGPPDAGKTTLARYLARTSGAMGHRVGYVSADPGQPAFGVPSCLALWIEGATEVDALWFVGAMSPPGHLLPIAVGAARLVARAQERGAATIVVDASGFLSGPAARALAVHSVLGAGAELVVAVGDDAELSAMRRLLGCYGVQALATSSPGARRRTPAMRRRARAARLKAHFADSKRVALDPACVISEEWEVISPPFVSSALRHRLAGVLDGAGFCLGLGVVVDAGQARLSLHTPVDEKRACGVQLSRLRLTER